jgi:hypothetical protein
MTLRQDDRVIVSLHVTTGAAGGALVGSRSGALLLGLALHGLGDAVPHHDIESQGFEIGSGATALLALAARYGPFHPVTIGALAASAPDIEHVMPLPRPGGRKLFPSHRVEGWHRDGGLPAWVQLAAAGTILAVLIARRR